MNHALLRLAASLCCGLIFGSGLALSGMLDPTRVRGFLDLFGAWDPSLAFVLAGAVVTSFIGVQLARRRGAPVFGSRYELTKKSPVDMALLAGSTIFGVGWGLSGLCPGPAVASLSLGLWPTFVFTAAMLVGMALFRFATLSLAGNTARPKRPRPRAIFLDRRSDKPSRHPAGPVGIDNANTEYSRRKGTAKRAVAITNDVLWRLAQPQASVS